MAAETLRGSPEGLTTTIPTEKKIATYGPRLDQTPKGPGFFGEVARTDDPEMFSTELSTTTGITDPKTGKEVLIPLMVPTLTAHEIAHLVDGGEPTKSIAMKAHAHALERLKAGKSPFAGVGEQVPLPESEDKQFAEGFHGKKDTAFAQTPVGQVLETALTPLFKGLDGWDQLLNQTIEAVRPFIGQKRLQGPEPATPYRRRDPEVPFAQTPTGKVLETALKPVFQGLNGWDRLLNNTIETIRPYIGQARPPEKK